MSFSPSSVAYSPDNASNSRQGAKVRTLKVRAEYQAAVAELGFQALLEVNLATLFNDAVSLVARTLNVQYVTLLELLPDRKSLQVSGQSGWYKGIIEPNLDIQTNLEISQILTSNQPVLFDNFRTENCFPISARLREYEIVSGILVPLPRPEQPLGILEAYSHQPHLFSQDDIHFLQAIANILSTAIERQRSNDLLLTQSKILELIATGATLQSILNSLCHLLEQLSPGAYCSILLLEKETNQLRSTAAPSLPPTYATAFDKLVIGDCVGSCGTAAYRGESVYVEDINTNPLWTAFRDFALSHNIHSCWSTPFFDQEGVVLGTFAISHSFPCRPTNHHLALMKTAAHLASIALQRKQY